MPLALRELSEVLFAHLLSGDGSGRQPQADVDHPLTVDLSVFEGGLLKDFIEERGALLPADELALAQSWAQSWLRLLEIQEVRPGVGAVRFTDLVSGEPVAVADRELVEHVGMPGSGEVRRGAIRRDNGRLVVTTNSLERLRGLQERLLAGDPDARLVDESSIPIAAL